MDKIFLTDIESDIYYKKKYADLYINNDNEIFEYTYAENEFYVKFKSIKRPIKSVLGVTIDEELYDLETPYGYGGPISNSNDKDFLTRALVKYRSHCKENKIVCEFIRLHPFNEIIESSFIFDMFHEERKVVIVNLMDSSEDRRMNYSKTTRNIVKKAKKNLVIKSDSDNIDGFIDAYYRTMKKNDANGFFFFDKEYFSSLKDIKEVKLIEIQLNDQLVSTGFFMLGNELAHYHLSANDQNLSKENGNYLLLDAAFEIAKEQGCKYMLLGGGRTSSEDDSLFRFKSKFSKSFMPFYIAGLDFLPEKRAELNSLWIENNNNVIHPNLFQLYRV